MTPEVAKCFADTIRNTIHKSACFSLLEERKLSDDGLMEGLNTLANGRKAFGAFLLKKDEDIFWILISHWDKKKIDKEEERYYVVLLSKTSTGSAIAEIHEQTEMDLKWRYKPSIQDGKNEERKEKFEGFYNTTKVVISLPSSSVTLDDTLNDLFHLARCKIASSKLDSTVNIEPLTFPEGKRLEKKHYARERSGRLVTEAKKEHAACNNGGLPCEICGFDFKDIYGPVGEDYIEAHHKTPLSELDRNETQDTKIADLAMVCANCHRMLHRSYRKTIEELKNLFGGK